MALCAEPALIPNAVEEVLRFDSSVIHWRRRTTTNVERSGVTVPADADVLVAIGAANRDPSVSTIRTCSNFDEATPAISSRSASGPTCASARRSPGSRHDQCSRS